MSCECDEAGGGLRDDEKDQVVVYEFISGLFIIALIKLYESCVHLHENQIQRVQCSQLFAFLTMSIPPPLIPFPYPSLFHYEFALH